jgi:deoxyribodipyrimidine photo-lyase
MISAQRVRVLNDARPRTGGSFVLYWMIAARRPAYNLALQHAARLAVQLRKPLLVFEPLRAGYRWASDRHHQFVLDGMADQAAHFARTSVTYYPYLEPSPGEGKGLLAALAADACAVVTDDSPAFFLPRMIDAARAAISVQFVAVDGNGLLPLAATDRAFLTAHAFRRFLQRALPLQLGAFPLADPLADLDLPRLRTLPRAARRHPPVVASDLLGGRVSLSKLPIDHAVPAVRRRGGHVAARAVLRTFIRERLARYPERNHPDADASSGLSAYLHFGHLSVHEILGELSASTGWSPDRLGRGRAGSRSGFWNMSSAADAFLDQLVTWRELGFNAARHLPDYDRFDSLPPWALTTLRRHRGDPRPHLYDRAELDAAGTHDALWNAGQREMVAEGTMHNYLRMLWGKKVLEWSPTPEDAFETLVDLNNKYELDGRDPNSCSGIAWVFGRYDRPWGPERSIFGVVRYMSSQNAARKLRLRGYLTRHGA